MSLICVSRSWPGEAPSLGPHCGWLFDWQPEARTCEALGVVPLPPAVSPPRCSRLQDVGGMTPLGVEGCTDFILAQQQSTS